MQTFTSAEVAKHNTEDDCWLIIDGYVYDVTKFKMLHPAGEVILLQYGGQDCTEDFYGLHAQAVLDKYGPKLLKGKLSDGKASGKAPAKDGSTSFGEISTVPYSEVGAWLGLKSPYYTEEHIAFRKYVREFYDKEVREIAEMCEDTGEPATLEMMQTISKAGLLHTQCGPGKHLGLLPMPMGIAPEKFDYFHEKILHEEQSRLQTPGYCDSLYAGFNISVPPIFNYGTDWMKKEVLPEVLAGRKRSCLAITEPQAGSDVAGLKCTARLSADGSHYIVSGVKKWITNGTFADYFVTAVRMVGQDGKVKPGAGPIGMLLIERSEGVETKVIKTSYSHSAGTALVIFENVKVPVRNLMLPEGKGFLGVMANFNHERWVIAVATIAGARYVTELCFKWATQRKVFGKPLIQQPVIRYKLGQMVAELETVHAYCDEITYQMCNMSYKEQSAMLGGPISFLKYASTRMAHNIADASVQIFGGRGQTKSGMGKKIAAFHRSYKLPSVYGGSEEIMLDLGVRQALRFYPRDSKL